MEHSAEAAAVATFITIQPVTIIALLALGFLGGMLSGFIGSGGAFVLTPGMMNLGVDGTVAVASNMCHKFPKALVGVLRRRKLGHVDVKLGLVMGLSAIAGVSTGVRIQSLILDTWGKAGSNLYISLAFVVVLLTVGISMLSDARKAVGSGLDDTTPAFPQKIARFHLPPMIRFPVANCRTSFWVTVPMGFATGILAATIAVGGFIGVPSMIYVLGAPTFVASGTELVVAFVMGMEGTYEWALKGFVDLRLVVLILAGSLVGVQVGAIGTTYVRQYMVKFVSGMVMVLAALSRGVMIPDYLADLHLLVVDAWLYQALSVASAIVLYGALLAAGTLIVAAMVRGKREAVKSRARRGFVSAPAVQEHWEA